MYLPASEIKTLRAKFRNYKQVAIPMDWRDYMGLTDSKPPMAEVKKTPYMFQGGETQNEDKRGSGRVKVINIMITHR